MGVGGLLGFGGFAQSQKVNVTGKPTPESIAKLIRCRYRKPPEFYPGPRMDKTFLIYSSYTYHKLGAEICANSLSPGRAKNQF